MCEVGGRGAEGASCEFASRTNIPYLWWQFNYALENGQPRLSAATLDRIASNVCE